MNQIELEQDRKLVFLWFFAQSTPSVLHLVVLSFILKPINVLRLFVTVGAMFRRHS
jgi:hypothetical protein